MARIRAGRQIQITHGASLPAVRSARPQALRRMPATEKPSAAIGHEITQRLGVHTIRRRPSATPERRIPHRRARGDAVSPYRPLIFEGSVEELNPATAENGTDPASVIVRNMGRLVTLQIRTIRDRPPASPKIDHYNRAPTHAQA